MQLKDYYAILELEHPATQTQIKKAYRKLAQTYHPDKNQEDPFAQARFADIKEAYEVLTNPVKRELYFQERWSYSSQGRKTTAETATPVSILKYLIRFERRLASGDQFRSDRESFAAEMNTVLNDQNLDMLRTWNENDTNREVIAVSINCLKYMPTAALAGIIRKLKSIAPYDDPLYDLDKYAQMRTRIAQWERWRIPLLLLLVVLICLLIFFISR